MYGRRVKHLAIVLAAFVWLMVPATGFADDNGIEEIRKPARFDSHEMNYQEVAKRNFAVIGTLDAEYADYVVVKDHSCSLARFADTGGVSVGDFVGVKLNEDGKVTALERLDRSAFTNED